MAEEDREIYPSPEDLEFSGPVKCPIERCGKELPSSACLRMHVTRRHQGKPLARAPGSLVREGCAAFYCPVRSCNRSKEGGQPFPRLGQLKQHYQTMHGEKNYSCSKCGKTFALRDACSRHEQECQQKIVCSSCGLDFRSRNALYQHAKRKGHTLPSGKKLTVPRPSNPSPPLNVVFVPVPTSIKLVVPLPDKGRVVSSATQTDEETSTVSAPARLASEVELQSSSSQTTLSPLSPSSSSFNHDQLLRSPSELFSLGTQTNFSPLPAPQANTSLVVSTQTRSAQLCDFGTQTNTDRVSCTVSFNTVNGPPTVLPGGSSICYNSHTEPSLDLVEFGTQTCLPLALYDIGESDTVDFGTQTIGMSDLDMDDALFCCSLLPPECLDFGTQTLDFPYDCSSHSYAHSSNSDTRDQSSQT